MTSPAKNFVQTIIFIIGFLAWIRMSFLIGTDEAWLYLAIALLAFTSSLLISMDTVTEEI